MNLHNLKSSHIIYIQYILLMTICIRSNGYATWKYTLYIQLSLIRLFFLKRKRKPYPWPVFFSRQQSVFLQRSVVTTSVAGMCRADDKGRVAGQRWQVASCHQSWRDGYCDILGLNNLRRNNASPLATAKCGSWLHVSLMPSPPNPFHNSAGTRGAAMCRHTAHWHRGHRR